MSHVIPPHVFQVLKSHRWNCNVLGRRRKFGHPNYVRVLGCEARGSNSYVRSSAQHALHGARDASTRMHICGPTQNHGSTCANGARTTARPHAPTKIPAFPYQQAERSLQNQHVLSILQVGSHQLQYRFFRINNPKSRHKTNTFCPLTPTARPHAPTKIPTFPHQKAKKSPFQQHEMSYNPEVLP